MDPPEWPTAHIRFGFNEPQYLTDSAQIEDMKTALHVMQTRICNTREEEVVQVHTLTNLTASCVQYGPFNQNRIILQRAMHALEYGQILYGPAALNGGVWIEDDRYDYEQLSKFSTSVLAVPSVPSPGWGTNTWITLRFPRGPRPEMKIRIQSVRPNYDKWCNYMATQFLIQVLAHIKQTFSNEQAAGRNLIITGQPMKIRLRVRLMEHAPAGLFQVGDELRALQVLTATVIKYEARNIIMSISLEGIPVATVYLEYLQPWPETILGSSTGEWNRSETPNRTSDRDIVTIHLSGSAPIFDSKMYEYIQDGNVTVHED